MLTRSFLSPKLGLVTKNTQTRLTSPADIIHGNSRGFDKNIYTFSLSPSSLGLEKLSSQTQLEYKRGFARD
jgi:hypothetical protein